MFSSLHYARCTREGQLGCELLLVLTWHPNLSAWPECSRAIACVARSRPSACATPAQAMKDQRRGRRAPAPAAPPSAVADGDGPSPPRQPRRSAPSGSPLGRDGPDADPSSLVLASRTQTGVDGRRRRSLEYTQARHSGLDAMSERTGARTLADPQGCT